MNEQIEELNELEPDEIDVEGNDEGDLDLSGEKPKINLDKNDRSLAEFNRWFEKGRLNVDPEWQRKYVWDNKRASKLIESFLIDLPVPVIYLSMNDEGTYEVIDGLQRLTSVFNFFGNKFKLQSLELLPELNGKFFKELDTEIQSKLEDTTLRTFELSQTSPKDLMFLIFERLNTGGMRLNDMEIRNCLYRGKLNDLIKQLSEFEDLKKSINQKGIEKRMTDRLLILRFLAFYQLHYTKARKGLKSFLNEFFETYKNLPESKADEFTKIFKKASKAAVTIFGNQSFRLRRDKTRGGGEWASRINATVFQVLMTSFADKDIGQLTRSADSIYEAYVDLISTDQQWVESVTSATGDYSRIEYTFKTWEERLSKALVDSEPNDRTRLFSKSLKESLYDQDPTCAICNQKITLILDAALDHTERYWEGGKTIPENARLTHRTCNLKRSKKD